MIHEGWTWFNVEFHHEYGSSAWPLMKVRLFRLSTDGRVDDEVCFMKAPSAKSASGAVTWLASPDGMVAACIHTTPKLAIRTVDDELMNNLTTAGLARVPFQQLTSSKHRVLARVQRFAMSDADEVITQFVFGLHPCHFGWECNNFNATACRESSCDKLIDDLMIVDYHVCSTEHKFL